MPKYQRVGLHVSVAGGVENAPQNALDMKAECFQIFSRSPRGGGAAKISDEQAKEYKKLCRDNDLESYIHAPYYINFASKNKRIYNGSISAIREELERASLLGVKYVVTHLGSLKDWEEDDSKAMQYAIKGLRDIYKGNTKFSARLLLEISAGAGSVLGDSFEELAELLKGIGREDVHVCLDTCHMFASGYDIRTKEALDETMKQFKKHIGLSQLKLVHINDSKAGLNEKKDRHEHIGQGHIGETGIKQVLKHPAFQKVNFILETKHDNFIQDDIRFLKKNRTAKA